MSELEIRAAQVVDVSYPKREIDLIVMPYETETLVPHPRDPRRLVTEIVSRGAFDGIEERGGAVRVNRDHQAERTIGRAVRFQPSRQEGLVAELYIARTNLGDETLEMANEGLLDASAGFALLRDKQTKQVKDDAEVWETRNRRRLNHLWLGHIAMVSDPAYETANVLAVRHTEPVAVAVATPNLDSLEIERLRQQRAEILARYS